MRMIIPFAASLASPFALAASKANLGVGIRQPLLIVTVDDEGVEENERDLHEVVFEPKVPTIGELSGKYGNLSAGYSHNLDGEDEDALDYTDYRLSYYLAFLGIDAAYTAFEHFRIADSTGFPDGDAERDQKLDLATTFVSANVYAFPLRWGYDLATSLEAAAEKQTGLGIGLIGSYAQTDLETPSGLVPDRWQAAFGPDGGFDDGSLWSANLEGAVGVTLAPGPFYLTMLGAAGQGIQHFEYMAGGQRREGKGIADKLNGQIQAGYSAKRTFLSLRYAFESPRYVLKNMSISTDSSDLGVQFGIKF